MQSKKILGIIAVALLIISSCEAKAQEDASNTAMENTSSEAEIVVMTQDDLNPNKSILGRTIHEWKDSLAERKWYVRNEFFIVMEASAKELQSRRDVEHFEKVGSAENIERIRRRDNPLTQLKPKKVRSKFVTDLNLSKSDFEKAINMIVFLEPAYTADEIAKVLPYIALSLNYGVKYYDLKYYLKWFTKNEIPVDIANDRLYRMTLIQD